MEEIACAKCGEGNPPEAVMCWACYTPLPGKDARPAKSRRRREAWEAWQTAQDALEAAPLVHLEIHDAEQLRQLVTIGGCTVGGALALGGLASLARRSPVGAAGVCGALLGLSASMVFLWREQKQQTEAESISDQHSSEDAPPIVRIADTILRYAAKDGASEIAVEPQLRGLRVRYLINGEWHEQMKIPSYVQDELIAEFKERAGLDVTQKRQMQQGFLATRIDEQEQVWRVATLPSAWGEAIVLRAEPMPFDDGDVTQHPLYTSIGDAV